MAPAERELEISRKGSDRRGGADRRQAPRGLRNAFLFSLFLDRRKGPERRVLPDRRER